jgi:integrase
VHQPNKAAILPAEGLSAFFARELTNNADLQDCAMTVVAFFGCLRGCELVNLEVSNLEEIADGIMIKVVRFKTTNNECRFLVPTVIQGSAISPAKILLNYLQVVKPWLTDKKQTRLWPRPIASGFCVQFRGKHHVAQVAKKIAVFLNLDPEKYSGHSFRRSAATAAADAGISMINLKRFGGWKSDSVAASYVDNSLTATREAADLLLPTTSSTTTPLITNEEVPIVAECVPPFAKQAEPCTLTESSSVILPLNCKGGPITFNFYVNNK